MKIFDFEKNTKILISTIKKVPPKRTIAPGTPPKRKILYKLLKWQNMKSFKQILQRFPRETFIFFRDSIINLGRNQNIIQDPLIFADFI